MKKAPQKGSNFTKTLGNNTAEAMQYTHDMALHCRQVNDCR
ncbi:hypothetical protein FHV99_004705 [Ochrobactrum sp. P20RRXII]|nr:hypothetical protein [Ochrobactrum sp. P20RRXII]